VAEYALAGRMWRDEVVNLLAAIAGSLGVEGVEDYQTPADRLADALAEAGKTPEDRRAERRARLALVPDLGDVTTVEG